MLGTFILYRYDLIQVMHHFYVRRKKKEKKNRKR
uniref:Uncharacterized protein n=1 Tax=Wuchereria bancrofti TaxID=6293 RepID=A0AAF5PVX3_WUCBA